MYLFLFALTTLYVNKRLIYFSPVSQCTVSFLATSSARRPCSSPVRNRHRAVGNEADYLRRLAALGSRSCTHSARQCCPGQCSLPRSSRDKLRNRSSGSDTLMGDISPHSMDRLGHVGKRDTRQHPESNNNKFNNNKFNAVSVSYDSKKIILCYEVPCSSIFFFKF